MKLKSLLKAFSMGLIKNIPIVGGIVSEVQNSKNEEAEHSPHGSIDYAKISGYVLGGVAILSLILGWIDEETFKLIFKQLNVFELLN